MASNKPAFPTKATGGHSKTECPVSRQQFAEEAKDMAVSIGERSFLAEVKQFSTGSMGWTINDKGIFLVDGVPCKCQVSLNVTIVGSKEAK